MAAGSGSSTRWLGVVSAIGLGSACGGSDPCENLAFDPPPEPDPSASAPPEVLAGEWIGAGVLELSFSGPLSSLGDLDPNRFAIVSWIANTDYDGSDTCSLTTRYSELTAGYSYYYYQTNSVAVAWIGPEDDTLLRLRLSSSASQCPAATGSLANGIMLVYTNAADPSLGEGLRDENDNVLPDLGPAWAIQQIDGCLNSNYCGSLYDFAAGHLPQLTSFALIPCP